MLQETIPSPVRDDAMRSNSHTDFLPLRERITGEPNASGEPARAVGEGAAAKRCGALRLMINVLQLGLVDYEMALKLQNSLVELRKQNRIADTLLLLEHPPVITLGRNSKTSNLRASAEELAARGVQIFQCNPAASSPFHCPCP